MREAIVRTVAEALAEVERCAALVGENRAAQALLAGAEAKLRQAMGDLQWAFKPLGEVTLDARDPYGCLLRLAECARRALDAHVEAHLDAAVAGALTEAQAEQVLHIVREGLANAIAHSGASRVALRVAVEPRRVVVRLSDDGRGFLTHTPQHRPDGGLATMLRRAHAAGGMLSVASAPAAGTIVTLTLPLS